MMDGVYYPEMDGAAMPEEGETDSGEGDRFDEIKDNAFISFLTSHRYVLRNT